MHIHVRLHLSYCPYLTFYSRNQVTLLSPRTSSGSKSTPISTPSALSLLTTLALPASPKSHYSLAHMPVHSSTFSRTVSCRREGHSPSSTHSGSQNCLVSLQAVDRRQYGGRLIALEITVNLHVESVVRLCWLVVYCILALKLVEKV